MKRILLLFFAPLFCLFANAQQMRVKQYNFTSFNPDQKIVDSLLIRNTPDSLKSHPEYGILPYNAPCYSCDEVLKDRTLDSRTFIEKSKTNYTYTQKSYFPLHYQRFAGDEWHTIDPRLRSVATQPGVYTAPNQPVPTKCDLNRKSTSLTERGTEFEFNHDLTMYFFDENVAYTAPVKGNYNNYTIGQEGLLVKNMWPGINMQQIFSDGEIETEYVINASLQLPINKGWLVIEDHFTLPEGMYFEPSAEGKLDENGLFEGEYLIKDAAGNIRLHCQKPVYVDAMAWGIQGRYKLKKDGQNYTLQTFVPTSWLNSKSNNYPITIDPTIFGQTKRGDYLSTAGASFFPFGFTTLPQSCNYAIPVSVQGKTMLKNVYLDLEYKLTYDNSCGNPHLAAPYCTFTQVYQSLQTNDCNLTTPLLQCRPDPDSAQIGVCTTDSNLVPGAGHINITNIVPAFLSCIPAQCPDYNLNFTLLNSDSTCGDACQWLCAKGHIYQVTVSACQVEGNITQDLTQVCAGQPVTFTAHPDCGVPPYHYVWQSVQGQVVKNDTVFNSPDFVIRPEMDLGVRCYIIDTCGVQAITNNLHVSILPAPPADAGKDKATCEGGTVTIGGSPTTNNTASILWSGENPTVESWLNSTTSANPTVTIPQGIVDTFFYVVKTTETGCFRTDTVNVLSVPNPDAEIDTTGPTIICNNQFTRMAVVGNYSSYSWNTGATTSSIGANQPGSYFAVVTDKNGCVDTSNIITLFALPITEVHVSPDTTIHYGDSVLLSSDVPLFSTLIDSFTWFPLSNISCLICTNPMAQPPVDQYYGVRVYEQGCVLSDSVLVKVILPNNYFIPNVFAPGGSDPLNHEFYIKSQVGVRVVSFQVFNRIGEKVHDGAFPWDGNYKGAPAPAGVYIYMFKLGLFGDDTAVFRKGSVTLIR